MREYRLDHFAFRHRPLGETLVARTKYLRTQMQEDWGDGVARLWNPPFDLLPLVVRKIEQEGGRGVVIAPHWPAQAWHARLVGFSSRTLVFHPADYATPLLRGARALYHWSVTLAVLG